MLLLLRRHLICKRLKNLVFIYNSHSVADSMRSVIVTTPDYETYSLVHTTRRLFQTKVYSASQKQDLNRRFAEGYKRLVLQSKGNPPQE